MTQGVWIVKDGKRVAGTQEKSGAPPKAKPKPTKKTTE